MRYRRALVTLHTVASVPGCFVDADGFQQSWQFVAGVRFLSRHLVSSAGLTQRSRAMRASSPLFITHHLAAPASPNRLMVLSSRWILIRSAMARSLHLLN
jgi:hypothetical protein